MKKILIISLFMIGALSFCFAEANLKARVAKLVEFEGEVQVMPKGSRVWSSAQEGVVLSEGDAIKTGPASSALLNIEGDAKKGSLVSLKENTRLNLDILKEDIGTNKKVTLLDVSIGKILIQAEKLQGGSKFEVKTPTSVVGVRGTKFAVEVDTLK